MTRFLVWSIASALSCVLVIGVAQLDLEALHRFFESASFWFALMRIGVFGSLVASWPFLLRTLVVLGTIDRERSEILNGYRWHLLAWLLALELLIGQAAVERLVVSFVD